MPAVAQPPRLIKVVHTLAGPKHARTARMSSPACSQCVANAWRNTGGPAGFLSVSGQKKSTPSP